MDRSSTLRLRMIRLNVVLLLSASIVCLHGNPVADDHDLHCVNDYLFTVNCTMSLRPSEDTSGSDGSYWLNFTETMEPRTFQCMLKNTDRDYFCSVKTSDLTPDGDSPETFSDTDTFKISLCRNRTDGSEMCEELDGNYTPETNIKPNAPCCLTFSHNSSQHHFTWSSTYEEYEPYMALVQDLKYQLHYFRRGVEHDDNEVISGDIYTERTYYSVDDDVFMLDADYTASVRSSPNLVFYQGQWSDWSAEVHWRTGSDMSDLNRITFFTSLGMKVFLTLCVLVPLILLMCYAPVKMWRQRAFIPSPAPYFHTLYSDCQGDFKRWVITQDGTADMPKAEALLQINTLTQCAEVPEDELQPPLPMEGSVYSNLINPESDTSCLGVRNAVNTMEPLSAPGSLTLCYQSGSPAEGDSGCWLCSDSSLEKDSPWYFSNYCTLGSLTQSSPLTAEHHGSLSTKCSSQRIISMDATGETQ